MTFLLNIGVNVLLTVLGIEVMSANNNDILQLLNSPNLGVMMVSLHVTGPILEELLFRGIFLEGLLRLFPNNKSIPILISSFLFAYVHIYELTPNLLNYFISGWLYSHLYAQSRQLGHSVGAHMLSNSLITLSVWLTGLLG